MSEIGQDHGFSTDNHIHSVSECPASEKALQLMAGSFRIPQLGYSSVNLVSYALDFIVKNRSMKSKRFGEEGPVPYRTDRIYSVGNEWFFSVRKGADQGPFKSEEEAKQAMIEFVSDALLIENLPNAKPEAK